MLLFRKENEEHIALKRPRTNPNQLSMSRCLATTYGTAGSTDSMKSKMQWVDLMKMKEKLKN